MKMFKGGGNLFRGWKTKIGCLGSGWRGKGCVATEGFYMLAQKAFFFLE